MVRVAVLLGGISPERPVSLVSGGACAAAARTLGHEVIEFDPQNPGWIGALQAARPDVVLNALHGVWGEDGRVQGVLDWLGFPYTHSGVAASALAMDKAKTKAVLRPLGVPMAESVLCDRREAAARHVLPPPYVVKPNAQGSSVGVYFVLEPESPPAAQLLSQEWSFGEEVLVEEFIPGKELTVAILGDRALGVTEIVPSVDFYDYQAKYAQGGSRHEFPAVLPAAISAAACEAALLAHQALGGRGVSRSDFRYDPERGRIVLLEVNSQPGMTPTSLAPEQALHCGIGFEALVAWMLEDASCPR